MSNRFIKSEIWDSEEFTSATNEQKILFFFVIQKCNNIGVYSISHRLASFLCGFPVTKDAVLSIPCDIEEIREGVFWMPKFCHHQYGELKVTCRPHIRYMEDLKTEGLYDRVCIPYTKAIHSLEDKEKEQDKDKDKEKDKDKDVLAKRKKKETSDSPEFLEFWSMYPKKSDRIGASKAFLRQGVAKVWTEAKEALQAHLLSQDWVKDGGQYIPHPTTWINKHRWEDVVKPPEDPNSWAALDRKIREMNTNPPNKLLGNDYGQNPDFNG